MVEQRAFSYRDWLAGGGLPLECWPLSALTELLESINDALEMRRLDGSAMLCALSWGEAIRQEIEARERLSWQDAEAKR